MKRLIFTFFSLLLMSLVLPAQNALTNKAYNESIRTVQVYPVGNPLGDPYLGLNSGEVLEFHFDEMDGDMETYYYGAIHCTADWQKSDISYNDYLQGFPSQRISDYEYSFSTMYSYVHYHFNFPTEMSKPRYSGNYLMVVSTSQDLSNEDDWVLTYRFLVYELVVNLVPQTKPSAVIADRFRKQQIDFTVFHKDFRIFDPMRDISATLMQNLDWNTSIRGLKPVYIKLEELKFEYSNGQNAFTAGTEWRNFEMKDVRFASSQVESIEYEADGYHVYLRPDLPLGGQVASSAVDLNGNYLIRNDRGNISDIEAEYVWVHFFLGMNEIAESEVIIQGRFADYFGQPISCTYNAQRKGYEAKVLMKQGYYNYRYAVRDRYRATDDISYTEGSDSQTENEYAVIIYYNDRSLECDRIIAFRSVNTVKRK